MTDEDIQRRRQTIPFEKDFSGLVRNGAASYIPDSNTKSQSQTRYTDPRNLRKCDSLEIIGVSFKLIFNL